MKEALGRTESQPTYPFPQTIDINPTARCNLDCSFCWGPDHSIPDGLDTQNWMDVIDFFHTRGTQGIVFTGGEPLLRNDIGELVQHAQAKEMNVTLSTNTLLLPRRAHEVLPYINEIGIPLDGSRMEQNVRMRLGTKSHFQKVVKAMSLVREVNPDVETTIRTVVSAVNKDDILQIGELLSTMPALFDRWKIYQFAPVSIGAAHQDEHQLTESEFNDISATISSEFPDLNTHIYPAAQRTGRYVFIGPEGNVFGVDDDGNYKVVANMLTSEETDINFGIQALLAPEKNQFHGQNFSIKS